MKHLGWALAAFTAAFFVGCKEPVWTKEDKKEFKSNCVNNVAEDLEYQQGLTYCQCALEYATSTYQDPDEARNLTKEDQKIITERCLKKAREVARD